jgi:hypothetical protein
MAMTALAFVKPRDRFLLRWILRGGQIIPSVELSNLSFVHIATWGIVRQPGKPWDGHLLFVSNFSGDGDEYIANFSDAITTRVNRAFGKCVDFPGAQPSPAFIDYVAKRNHKPSVYYSYYPDATVRDVGAALRAAPRIARLRTLARKDSPVRFVESYFEALNAVQPRGAAAIVPKRRFQLFLESLRGASVSSLSVIFTVKPEKEIDIPSTLGVLRKAAGDVFERVEGTHFARFVVLPRQEGRTSLLFSAQVDGSVTRYVKRLWAAKRFELEAVWDLGEDCPDPSSRRGFSRWFKRHSVPSYLFISEAGHSSRQDVRRALAEREELLNFVAQNQGKTTSSLPANFIKRFPQVAAR